MNNIWFSADHHFGHKNILHLGKGRPFKTIEEMEETMIENWNGVVQKNDIVYYLGDFAFKSQDWEVERLLQILNGQKILITGNHDAKVIRRSRTWTHVWDYHEIKIEGQKIVLSHYPFQEWNGSWKGSWHLHGHCHHNLKDDPNLNRIDVGVDGYNYTPISFEQVEEIMSHKLEKE